MKNLIITLSLIILHTITNYSQNKYSIQPGMKNNQIVLELSNISLEESAQITTLPNLSKGGAYERIKFTGEKEKQVELLSGETKEIIYFFDVEYDIGKTEADTLEFMITDNKSIYQTKQFILQYSIPTEYKLEQNYPNPFNPTTKIRYQIPNAGTELAETELKVFDILGNEVATLVNEQKEPGYYEVEFSASQFASGVYIYRLKTTFGYSEVKKMLLLK